MALAHAMFQKERHETVGEVAYTRYRIYIDISSIKCLSSHPGKNDKKLSEDSIKTKTMTKAPVMCFKSVSNKWYEALYKQGTQDQIWSL